MLPHLQNGYSSRRDFLKRSGAGFGMLGLNDLLASSLQAKWQGDEVVKPHHLPKAKAVIWLYMYGAPSAIDLFDPKPVVQKRHGERLGETIDVLFGNPGPIMASPFSFKQYGQSGAWVSELFPNVAKHVDDLCFIKSCTSDSNNHAPAVLQMNTGWTRVGFPSAGSWVTYGLGSENKNLPGYIVMHDPRSVVVGGPPNWGSGFLPSAHQGVVFRSDKHPILYLKRPDDVSEKKQRAQLDLLKQLNQHHLARHPGDMELESRIESFELAFRMQMAGPEVVDLTKETEATKELYGLRDSGTAPFGTQLLLARRLVERGVRFVQIYSGGTQLNWDAHQKLEGNHRNLCYETDKPIAGLLTDLKARGMLKDTLVIWGAEFGRMPISQDGDGRDHNPNAFLMWLAGGGVKPGISYGSSDELGYKVADKPVTVHDFHATLLHLLGLDHKRLTYQSNGRAFRLTDVAGEVVKGILS